VLVVPAAGTEGLKSLHLGLDVVGLQVEVHPFLGDPWPGGSAVAHSSPE
jgi:hypothetical protein